MAGSSRHVYCYNEIGRQKPYAVLKKSTRVVNRGSMLGQGRDSSIHLSSTGHQGCVLNPVRGSDLYSSISLPADKMYPGRRCWTPSVSGCAEYFRYAEQLPRRGAMVEYRQFTDPGLNAEGVSHHQPRVSTLGSVPEQIHEP